LEAWALQKLTGLETFCHARMRRESFPRRWFVVSLLSVSALAACTGLLLSQTSSLKDPNKVCKGRFAIATPKLASFREEFWENASGPDLTPGVSVNQRS
jgi:hypothetical protein